MPYLRLLKLMYIAERELLAQTATPLTGDIAIAMEHGPVLGQILDLVKGKGSRGMEWEGFIMRSDYAVKLVAEPGRGRLSGDMIDKLTEVSAIPGEGPLGSPGPDANSPSGKRTIPGWGRP